MQEEKEYLVNKLREAGIQSQVVTSMKSLKLCNDPHIGAVLRNGETFTRFAAQKTYVEGETKKRRYKLFKRETALKVVIGDANEDRCEEILLRFLSLIGKGIEINGNWSSITVGAADWVESGDSILKSKIAVEFEVTFEGGIFEDIELRAMQIGTVK